MRQAVKPDLPGTHSPMDTLREALEDRGLSMKDLLSKGITEAEVEMLSGPDPLIDEDLSTRLSTIFEISPLFWARLDANHRAAKLAGKPVLSTLKGTLASGQKRSGNISMRVSSSLHQRLLELAKAEGISLNQLLLAIVAEGVGRGEQKLGLS